MLKSFILIYRSNDGERKEILDYLNTLDEVENWYAIFPSGIIIVSEEDADTLSELFLEEYPKRDHLIVQLTSDIEDTQGWLDEDIWDFINDPSPV